MKIIMSRKDGAVMSWQFEKDTNILKLVRAIKENEPTWKIITIHIENVS